MRCDYIALRHSRGMQDSFFRIDEILEPEIAETADHGLIQRLSLAMEHFVAADILQRNWDCSFAAASLRYDLIADVAGLRRVQVKMATKPKLEGGNRLYYKFGQGIAACLQKRADSRLSSYAKDIDLFAFVAGDIKKVIYVLPSKIETQKLLLPASDFTSERSDISWLEALREWRVC